MVRTLRLRYCLAALLFGLTVCGNAVPGTADIWQANKGYVDVLFSWNNLGLSRQAARFTDVEGTLDFAPTNPAGGTVDVRIKAASIQSTSRAFDDLLRRPEFFDAASYPYITFKSTAVRPATDRTGQLDGELTIRGITKPVTLDVTWNFTGEHPLATVNPSYMGMWVAGFSARARLRRSDWALDRGLPLVSDEIEVAIEAEFTRKSE